MKYLGLGASAHSYDGNSRQWNVSNLTKYINTDFDTDTDFFERELLTKDDKFNEYVMTSLRTSWGCDINKIASEYGISYANHFLKNVKSYVDKGIMLKNDNFCSLNQIYPINLFLFQQNNEIIITYLTNGFYRHEPF